MSDSSQGHGWWQASDGKWYAPELHPEYSPPSSSSLPTPVPPGYQAAPQQSSTSDKAKKPIWRRGWFIALAGLVVLVVAASAANVDETGTSTQSATESDAIPADPIDDPPSTTAPRVASPPAPSLTRSQENAIGSAEDYLNVLAFSRKGLIEQLEYEGFSAADATFAVDHLRTNWNEQAARSAEDYLDVMSFSCQGLIEQLEFEGFTRSEAAYGADKTGLC